jgi:hypothetical protein
VAVFAHVGALSQITATGGALEHLHVSGDLLGNLTQHAAVAANLGPGLE